MTTSLSGSYFAQLLAFSAATGSVSHLDQLRLLGDLHFALQGEGADPSLVLVVSAAADQFQTLEPKEYASIVPSLLPRLETLYRGAGDRPLTHPLEDPREKGRIDYPLPAQFRTRFISLAEGLPPPAFPIPGEFVDALGSLPDSWRKFRRATLTDLADHFRSMKIDTAELRNDPIRHGDYLAERFNNKAGTALIFKEFEDRNDLQPEDIVNLKKVAPILCDFLLLAAEEARLPDSVLFHQFWKKLAVNVKMRLGDVLAVLKTHPPR